MLTDDPLPLDLIRVLKSKPKRNGRSKFPEK